MASSITDKEVCVVCYKRVFDKGVECDNDCKRWFHPACMDISTAEYKKIADGIQKTWKCGRVDCTLADVSDPPILSKQVTDLNDKFELVIKKLDKLDKLDSLAVGVEDIRKEISEIKDGLHKLEPRVASNESEIVSLKVEVANLTDFKKKIEQTGSASGDEILEEFNERIIRQRNVIIHGLEECRLSNQKDAKSMDEAKISQILVKLKVEGELSKFRCFRLGKPLPRKNRPLKVIFQSESDATRLLRAFALFIKDNGDDELKNVSISNDRTPKERDHLQKLRAELEDRKKNGEANITIKYTNGIPKIVQTKN